jgi:hypothetical protein
MTERTMPEGWSDERSLLDGWLDYYRATLLAKCDGLTCCANASTGRRANKGRRLAQSSWPANGPVLRVADLSGPGIPSPAGRGPAACS